MTDGTTAPESGEEKLPNRQTPFSPAFKEFIPQGWAPYSDEALATARAKGAVFVDFTAAWCVTCQVNKRVVLATDAVKQAFADRAVTTMRADWTHRDEHITQALARLNRSGVPVYALYPAGGGAPELLPELLTRDVVLEALARSAPRTAGGR